MLTGFPRTRWLRRRFSESYAVQISVKISRICEFRVIIYIIIAKFIRYLLWNWGVWHFFHDTYLAIEDRGIRCTNHLHDSCPLTDINPHFTTPGCRYYFKINSWWPIVTSSTHGPAASYCDVTLIHCSHGYLWTHTSSSFSEPRVSTRGIASGNNDQSARVLFVQHPREHPREQGKWFRQNPRYAQVLTASFALLPLVLDEQHPRSPLIIP